MTVDGDLQGARPTTVRSAGDETPVRPVLILSDYMASVRSANAPAAEEQRALQIADTAAFELVTSEGWAIGPQEFRIALCEADEHTRQCIEHPVWRDKAHARATDDGYIVVQLGEEV